MAWNSPRTWTAGEYPTAAQFNQDIRDNENAIVPLAPDAWTSYTPTLTQSGAVTKTVDYSRYTKIGRLVTFAFALTVTGSGTAANNVTVSLPFTAAGSVGTHAGVMLVYDSSTTTRYNGNAELNSTTTCALSYNQASTSLWGTLPNIALAVGDIIRGTITYEATS